MSAGAGTENVHPIMSFSFRTYASSDFSEEEVRNAIGCRMEPAPMDGAAPDSCHSTMVFPEYFRIDGKWILAEESSLGWRTDPDH